MLEGALVVFLLLVVVAGTQLPPSLLHARLTPDVLIIALGWVVGLFLLDCASKSLPWSDSGDAPDTQPEPRGNRRTKNERSATDRKVSTARAATALPELSTGIASARMGDFQLAISDIFGGNAFLPVLFLPATLISGGAVLPAAGRSDIYLTALGAALTVVYVMGLVIRPRATTPAWAPTRSSCWCSTRSAWPVSSRCSESVPGGAAPRRREHTPPVTPSPSCARRGRASRTRRRSRRRAEP